MVRLIAGFVTMTAASMTAVAAWDRGGTMIDKALLVAMSVVIVLAVHLIPALSRRPAAWLVWTGCLFCAIYGHLTFLTHASLRAGETRAQQSALAVGTEKQIEEAREALAETKARPVAIVAAELAISSNWRERAALRAEITEGKRAEALRDELVRLSGVSTTAQVTGAADPVTARLAEVTAHSEGAVAAVIGMTFSVLIELVGALLWYEAMRGPKEAVTVRSPEEIKIVVPDNIEELVDAGATDDVTDPVTALTKAIQAGKCRGTVAGIRGYLNCSQARAMELRRELVAAAA
jgi:hypothetical protein